MLNLILWQITVDIIISVLKRYQTINGMGSENHLQKLIVYLKFDNDIDFTLNIEFHHIYKNGQSLRHNIAH